jgi:hypothetical protein
MGVADMTGPEAEQLARQVADGAADWKPIAALAQVHATLALAAATAVSAIRMPPPDYDDWRAVAAAPELDA